MLEICISGVLIVSILFGMFLWPVLIAAKRADACLLRIDETYVFEPVEEKVQRTRPANKPVRTVDV